jgi:4-alpha-glucanotransferase
MSATRQSGVLLHPTSLPGAWGIGDLGPAALQFLDFLAEARQSLWQVLPLGPTGYGDSPYQCFSAFAGNPLLLSPDRLREQGLLHAADLADAAMAGLQDEAVDYGAVYHWKTQLLQRCTAHFRADPQHPLRPAFAEFCRVQAGWLDDYALFMALKTEHGGAAWRSWAPALRRREPQALAAARTRLQAAVEHEQLLQFLFAEQWTAVKAHAAAQNIRIIGDAPIFVAYDSADVWAHPELFYLNPDGSPSVVAGVPPDYFSATGQLWGNPLYDWSAMAADGYAWWVARIRRNLEQFDLLRLDHFRGFEAYWEVPGDAATAIDGRWVPGPGAALFSALERALGPLPIIAEDLGLITPEVDALRREFNLPGMKVLQFAFGAEADNVYLPQNYEPNTVVYSGTHDNDTTLGWFLSLDAKTRTHVQTYLGRDGSDIAWDLLRLAWQSVAETAIVPLQDVLRLDGSARMNTPGQAAGNWSWRFRADQLSSGLAAGLALLTEVYGRCLPSETAERA